MPSRNLLGASVALVCALAACGGAPVAQTPTAPAGQTPTNAPTLGTTDEPASTGNGEGTPNPAASRACQLLTVAEVGAAVGEPVTVADAEDTSCTYSAAAVIPTVIVRVDSGETLDAARLVFDDDQDISVAGHGAVIGGGNSLLYVDMGLGHIIVLQAIWSLEGDAARAALVGLAEKAIARFG